MHYSGVAKIAHMQLPTYSRDEPHQSSLISGVDIEFHGLVAHGYTTRDLFIVLFLTSCSSIR